MSAGYLQRLLDRSVPSGTKAVATEAVPSAPSASPIAQWDQRLNDPDLAAQLGYGVFAGFEGDPDAPPLLTPTPEGFRPRPIRPAPPAFDLSPPRVAEAPPPPSPPPGRVEEAAHPVPASPAATVAPVPVPPPADWGGRAIPLLDVEPPAHDLSRTEPRPSARVDEPPAGAVSPVRPALPDPWPAPPEVFAAPAYDPPPSPVEAPAPAPAPALVVAEPTIARPAPAPAAPFTDRWEDDLALALPPTPAPPDPPVTMREPPAAVTATDPRPAPATATPTTTTPEPSPPRAVRPMTAAAASVIGPLAPRARSMTVFGTRRR